MDGRPRGREASRASSRHHGETIDAMEEVAKMTQRRMRELEITVKLQYAQMDRMEKAALAEKQMRAREAATAMRGARTVEGLTANRTMEQMDAM
eukprot:8986447-Heterocapsa_arctica.AAC.1